MRALAAIALVGSLLVLSAAPAEASRVSANGSGVGFWDEDGEVNLLTVSLVGDDIAQRVSSRSADPYSAFPLTELRIALRLR